IDAPRGALGESDIRLIREHRDDIVELLRQIQLQRETPEPRRRGGEPGSVPLSAVQQNVLLMESLAPGRPYGIIPLAFRVEGPVDRDALERALADVMGQHEVLRTTYPPGGAGAVQQIHASLACKVAFEDVAGAQDRDAALEAAL